MFTCKQVSKALSHEDYEKLSPMRKFFLKIHVRMCLFCGKFNRQVMDSQDMCRCFKDMEKTEKVTLLKMDETQKEALKSLLAKHPQADSETTPES